MSELEVAHWACAAICLGAIVTKVCGKQRSTNAMIRSALVSVSTVALGVGLSTCGALAQQAPGSGASTLPPVVVSPSENKQKKKPREANESASRTRRAAQTPARTTTNPVTAAWAGNSQDQRTGTVGYFQNSTSVATKTNTPLLDIPQTVNVLTKDFIQDQGTHSVTDLTRYVPGVAVHQGEGNRDELVIRGVDSSANFYVNGFRDDVQYFRDLYNAQSVEILKGPSALVFGRASGGGLLNRTLKEADGTRVYEASAQTGSYNDRRFTLDAGQAINENVAVRFNAFYEGSDTFRDFGHLERYGFNPTITLQPTDDTKVKLSYEYYYDNELADRGNPSTMNAGTTRFNSAAPFAPNGDMTAFFGSPTFNSTHAIVNQTMAVIDHDFGNGLTVKNSTIYADFDRGYQNVYPGGPVSTTTGPSSTFPYAAYQHATNRRNFFNQTDFTYKTWTGPIYHTIAFGTEFGQQHGVDLRNTGTASLNPPNGNSFDPTYFGNVAFNHLASDSDSEYRLNTDSAYVQDQIDVTRWLKLIGGVRFDRFDMAATDQNTHIGRQRTDDKLSPRAAIIVKPVENLSIYTAYSISYLPSTGDQFSALNTGSALIPPQEFENTEVGVKWDINPRLAYTAAVYQLNRTNVPLATGGGLFAISGKNVIKGFETALTGYVTNDWQTTLGYAYTDARIASDTNSSTSLTPPPPTILAGNRVQLVPYNQVSLWNKYQFDPQFSAGLGVIYFSDSFAASDDFVKLPGFVRFDGSLYYKFDQTWTGQLNVENIFDKGYWASADGNNNISPGQGRTFRVLARAHF